MFPAPLLKSAETLLDACRNAGLTLTTAESCTGGLIAALLTEISGASDVFDRGFITYSNQAKSDMLGVPSDLLARHGAVSEPVAAAMAAGALAAADADLAVAVTGIAGPGGGTAQKPVGMVCFGLARSGHRTEAETRQFGDPGRQRVRLLTVEHAVGLMARAFI